MATQFNISPGNFTEFQKTLKYLNFMRCVCINQGKIHQEIEDGVFVESDLTSILQKNDFFIEYDESEIQELQLLNPGNNDAVVSENDLDYTITAENNTCIISKYFGCNQIDHQFNISGFKKLCSLPLDNKKTKKLLKVTKNKGPLKFIIEDDKYLTNIINSKDTNHNLIYGTNISSSPRSNNKRSLYSYFLNKLDATKLEIGIYSQENKENSINGNALKYWVELIATIGTGLTFKVYEELIPDSMDIFST